MLCADTTLSGAVLQRVVVVWGYNFGAVLGVVLGDSQVSCLVVVLGVLGLF